MAIQLDLGEVFTSSQEQIQRLVAQARRAYNLARPRLVEASLRTGGDSNERASDIPPALGAVTLPITLGTTELGDIGVGIRYYRTALSLVPRRDLILQPTHDQAIPLGAAKFYGMAAFDTEIERELWRRYFSLNAAGEALKVILERGSIPVQFLVVDHALRLDTREIDLYRRGAGVGGPLPRLRTLLQELAKLASSHNVMVIGFEVSYRSSELLEYLDSPVVDRKGGGHEDEEIPSRIFGSDFVFLNGVDPDSLSARYWHLGGNRAPPPAAIRFMADLPPTVSPAPNALFHRSAEAAGALYHRGVGGSYIRFEILQPKSTDGLDVSVLDDTRLRKLRSFLQYHLDDSALPRVVESALSEMNVSQSSLLADPASDE